MRSGGSLCSSLAVRSLPCRRRRRRGVSRRTNTSWRGPFRCCRRRSAPSSKFQTAHRRARDRSRSVAHRRLGRGAAAALRRHGRLRSLSVHRSSRTIYDEAVQAIRRRLRREERRRCRGGPRRSTRSWSRRSRQQAPYSRDNIKFFSSVLAHYVADAHVPFHAALNYDGQLTGSGASTRASRPSCSSATAPRCVSSRSRAVPMTTRATSSSRR